MKRVVSMFSYITVSIVLGSVFCFSSMAFADEDGAQNTTDEIMKAATSISISPVSKVLQLEPDKVYEDSFEVSNNGSDRMKFEVYASPYSYTFSEEENSYKLGFSRENNYTQITRWISFRDTNGEYVQRPQFIAEPEGKVEVHYRITTPSSIPAGGQYAVLFAHTLSESTTSSGIKTEASPGLVVYGRSEGETVATSEISGLELLQKKNDEGNNDVISGSAKVKNTGNVDFMAYGVLRATGLFGQTYYETPSNQGRISVIPESELVVTDTWKDMPYFGIFNVSWTVHTIDGEEVISRLFVIMPLPIILLVILLLTIITIWIIIAVRKRTERRSRYSI